MAKLYDFQRQITVPDGLLNGASFDRYDEDSGNVEPNCLFRVDEYAFFIIWKSEGREGQVLDLSQINDVRKGIAPKVSQIKYFLSTLLLPLLSSW